MDTRKIQKTGDMHYLYLPTSWCKQNGIKAGSTVMVNQNWNGELAISSELVEKDLKDIALSLNVDDEDVINKILVACYINPLKSFQITLEKNTDYSKLLGQKNLISLESVEFDSKRITGQSAITVAEPDALLRTMLMKIKNMLVIMTKKYDQDLINRYEEEIDRSKMIIDKAIIGALTNSQPSKNLKAIDLYYLSSISRDLERMADHLILMDSSQAPFFATVADVIDSLRAIMETITVSGKGVTYKTVIGFIKKVGTMGEIKARDVLSYDKRRVRDLLDSISEVLADWAVTKQIE